MMKGTKAVTGINIKRLVFGICVAFVLLCAFMGVSVASAKTIYVPDDHEKIQWAVDNASAGDTIIVRDGTYTENINVNKPHLTIRSENGADSTIVHAANPDDHVFEVTADYVNISGFTVEGASGGCKAGIYLEYVQYCNISNNNLLNNSWGIYFYASSNNIIRNNKASNNDDAIYLDFSSNNSVSNNNLSNNGNGISVYSSFSNLISNNIINSNNYNGISVTSSSYNKITNNTISYCNTGIVLGNSSDNTIINNICNFNSYSGIYFWKFVEEGASSNNSVINNTCVSNEIGIFLDASPNNKLLTNNCSLNNIGVELSCLCNNTAIWNNFIYSNSVGIFVGMSTNISICNNTVIQNNCGISIAGSSYGEIKNNSICSNKYGMCITPSSINDIEWTSSDNTIYLNNFIDNTNNVYSYNSTNIWNSTSKITYTYNGKTYTNYLGNYWSDYTGSDANGDGIGDTPYSIDGDKDYYPLMERFENYFGGVEEEYNPKVSVPPYAPLAEYGHVGTNLTFIIKVENKGTKEDTIDLTARPYYPAGLDISLSKDSVTLSPSESELIYLNVTVKSESYNPITIIATSEGDETKVSSCEVKTGEPISLNPLYFSFWFDTKGHALAFNAPEYVKLNEISQPEEKKELEIVFDPKSSQTSIREFYVEVTDKTSGETVKIPIKLNSDYNIIATDFDVSEDGYNFKNWPLFSILGREIGGHCYPMSETSILYYKKMLSLPDDAKNTYAIPKPTAEPVINAYLWGHLGKNLAAGASVKNPFLNETKEYEKLRNNISAGNPVIVTVWDGHSVLGGIHHVVAYKVVEIGDKAYISIYDNEFPYGCSFYNTFSVAIFNKTSSEFNYWDTFKKFVVTEATLLSSDTTTLALECPVNATITDQYGRIIADDGTNEIPNASMIITNETKIFYLPADLTYSVDIDAYDAGIFNFTRVSPVGNDISITKFEDISVTESTKASVEIVPNVTNYTMSIDYNGDGEIDEEKSPDVSETIVVIENIFDTGAPENPYPSISGTFKGTITPYKTIIVKNLYTYPCEGTGGHTEYVRIYNEGTIAEAEWKGYKGDWHNITFPKKFTLEGGKTYNITIVTGSYPQIHHTSALQTENGWINCTEFIDANGNKYNDWIPAIMLWS